MTRRACPSRFARMKSSASLLEAIDPAIAELDEEGELSRISEKYFGKDITKATTDDAEADAADDTAATDAQSLNSKKSGQC